MTHIYLDPSALMLQSSDPGAAGDQIVPGADDAVRHLVEAGFEVIVLDDGASDSLDALVPGSLARMTALPEHLDSDAWYLTGEPSPRFGRPRGGTTVLVGPKRPQGHVPLSRFDLEVRDLPSAAIEILTRQAMA